MDKKQNFYFFIKAIHAKGLHNWQYRKLYDDLVELKRPGKLELLDKLPRFYTRAQVYKFIEQ